MGNEITPERFFEMREEAEGLNCQEMAAHVHDLVMTNDKSWHQPTWGQVFNKKFFKKTFDKRKEQQYTVATCPTTGCVAGWTATLAGDQMIVSTGDFYGNAREASIGHVMTADGEVQSISYRGATLLCLKDQWLFDGARSLNEVLFALEELANGQQPSRTYESDIRQMGWKPTLLRGGKQKKVEHVKAEAVTPQRTKVLEHEEA